MRTLFSALTNGETGSNEYRQIMLHCEGTCNGIWVGWSAAGHGLVGAGEARLGVF
jgi:hypothetical protein